jgi:hypothetical protein
LWRELTYQATRSLRLVSLGKAVEHDTADNRQQMAVRLISKRAPWFTCLELSVLEHDLTRFIAGQPVFIDSPTAAALLEAAQAAPRLRTLQLRAVSVSTALFDAALALTQLRSLTLPSSPLLSLEQPHPQARQTWLRWLAALAAFPALESLTLGDFLLHTLSGDWRGLPLPPPETARNKTCALGGRIARTNSLAAARADCGHASFAEVLAGRPDSFDRTPAAGSLPASRVWLPADFGGG